MEIPRKSLYDRVWTTPLVKLAKEFGVSDVGLAKACRRHGIPTPPPGHWAKLAHGKDSPKPPLPAWSGSETVKFDDERPRQQRVAVRASEFPSLKVSVAANTNGLAPFARATFLHLSKAKPTGNGFLVCGGPAFFSCSLSVAQRERAVLVLDAIERALPAIGGKLVRGTDQSPLALDLDGQRVTFSLTEKYPRTSFIPEKERKSIYPLAEFEYHFTGELKIAIDGYFDGRKSWSDGVRARLEEKLEDVVLGLAAAAAAIRKREEELAAEHRKWEEEARIRREHEESERRKANFRELFSAEVAAWQRHHEAAAYLSQLEQSLKESDPLPEASAQWLALAREAVAGLDPTPRRLKLLRAGYQPESWQGPFGQKLVAEKPAGVHF